MHNKNKIYTGNKYDYFDVSNHTLIASIIGF